MIESRLNEATDGTGGGYGTYPGLTVSQIADRFRALAAEGHHRSARAILRIVHEQTAARGTLWVQRLVAGLALVATALLAAARVLLGTKGKVDLYLAATSVVTLLFVVGAASVERTRRRNVAQVREIRRLALIALEDVVANPRFAAKPLEREHLRSLKELRSADRATWEGVFKSLGLEDLKA